MQKKIEHLSFKRQFIKNYNFVGKVLIQGDTRYFDPLSQKILAQFLTKKAIIARKRVLPAIEEPEENELINVKWLNEPQKLAKYIAYMLLKKEGFKDSEIFFERNFEGDRPDVVAINNDRHVSVECFSCRINKVIDYLLQDCELWILTSGAYPWNKSPLSESIEWFVFQKGPNWEEVFQQYKQNIEKSLEEIKNPFDEL